MYRQVGGALPIGEYEGPTADRQRKQEYLHELQRQAEEDRARKNQARQSIDEPTGLALGSPQRANRQHRGGQGGFFPDIRRHSAEDYHEQARRQRLGGAMGAFDAERRPDGPDKPPSGTEQGDILRTIKRWEDIFTQQMSSSMQAITDLNKKVVDLEEDLTHQAREKQLLRERVEQGELLQRDLQQAKTELQHAMQQRDQINSGEREKWQQEMQKLHGIVSAQRGKWEEASMSANRRADALEVRLVEEAQSRSALLGRMDKAERILQAVQEHVSSGTQQQVTVSSRHHSALADVQEVVERLESKVQEVARHAEAAALKVVGEAVGKREEELLTRILGLEQEATQTRRGLSKAELDVKELQDSAAHTEQSKLHTVQAQLGDVGKRYEGRLEDLDRGLVEERAAREKAWERMQGQLNHVSSAITDAIRSADADHAGLLEALHDKLMEQLSQQDRFGAALQEALEGKRAFLEQVVRAEIQNRNSTLEDLRGEMEKRMLAAEAAAAAAKEELESQVNLVGAKVKAAERGLRQATAQTEASASNSERAREETQRELEQLQKHVTELESGLTEAMRRSGEDVESQIRAVKASVETGGVGARARTAEVDRQGERDRAQDQRIGELLAQLQALEKKLEGVMSEQQQANMAIHGALPNLKMKQSMLHDEVEGARADMKREHEASRSELDRRMERSQAALDELKREMLEALAQAQHRSEEQHKEAEAKTAATSKDMDRMREELEERSRQAETRGTARWKEAADMVESVKSEIGIQQADLRREVAGVREAATHSKQRVEGFVAETREWKLSVDRSQRASQEEFLHAQELVGEELKRLFEAASDIRRATEAKFARLDVKVTEDVRKIVSALATHKETLEEQERVTSERMGELQKEEEKQLKRLWEALREHKAKARAHFEEMRAGLHEEQHKRQEQSLQLQGQVDQLLQRSEEGKAEVEKVRAEEEERLQTEIAKLRDEMSDAEAMRGQEQHELDYAVQAIKHAHEVDLKAVREEADARAEKEKSERERVEQLQQHAQQELERLERELEGVRAVQSGEKKRAGGEIQDLTAELEKVRRSVRQEESERQAAVTEVYRRMQVQREMDAMLNQVQEQMLRSEVEDSKKQLQSFSSTNQASQQEQMRTIDEALSSLREQEEELKTAQSKHAEELAENNKRALAAESALGASLQLLSSSLASEVSTLQDSLSANQENLGKRISEVEKKSEERDEKIEERVTKLEGDHDSRISNLEESLSSVQASVEVLEESTQEGAKASKEKDEEKQKKEGALLEKLEELERKTKERDDEIEAKIGAVETSLETESLNLDSKLKNLEEKAAKLEKEKDEEKQKKEGELVEKLEELERKTKERDDEIEAKIGAVETNLETESLNLDSKLKNLEEKSAKLEQGGEQSASEVAAKVAELDERTTKVEGEYVSKQSLEAQLKQLDDKLEQDFVTDAKLKAHVKEQVDPVNSRVEATEKDVEKLSGRVEAVEGMGKEVEGMKGRVGKLETLGKELDELRIAKADEKDLRNNDLERFRRCEEDVKELKRGLKQIESKGISEEAVAKLAVITGLNEKLDKCEGRVEEVEKKHKDAAMELDSKLKELKLEDEKKAEKNELEFKVNGLNGELETIRNLRAQDAKRLEEVEKGAKEAKKRVDKLDSGKGGADPELENRVKKLESSIESSEQLLEQSKAILAKHTQQLKGLESLKDMEVDVNNKVEQFKSEHIEPLNYRIDELMIPSVKKDVNETKKHVEKLDESFKKMGQQVAEVLKMVEDLGNDET